MNVPLILRDSARAIIDASRDSLTQNCDLFAAAAFRSVGYSELRAEEMAEEWRERFKELILAEAREWTDLGLPTPVAVGRSSTIFSSEHSRYESVGGSLVADFWKVLDDLRKAESRRTLAYAGLYLLSLGADPIFCTDGAGDGGVDLVGRVKSGGFHSCIVFVQSKSTSGGLIDHNTLLADIGKYEATPAILKLYVESVGATRSADGICCCYMFLTNGEFTQTSRKYAMEKRTLLRSGRQISYWLSKIGSAAEIIRAADQIMPALSKNLSRNLAREMTDFSG